MLIVISLGGSILVQDFNGIYIQKYATILSEIGKKHKLIIITGGGLYARKYIQLARIINSNETECDLFGIALTRINAQLLITSIKKLTDNIYFGVPKTYEEALIAHQKNNIVIMGGITPGQTTDAVASIMAEYINADIFLIATSVDGIYTSDPKTDTKATKYDSIDIKDILKMSLKDHLKAGSKSPIDLIACKIIERSHINTIIYNGNNVSYLLSIINNKDEILYKKRCLGTVINFEK